MLPCYHLLSLLIIYGVLTCNGLRTRIINGIKSPRGEFPYQASVQVNNKQWCGGVILDQFHILTTAHCFIESTYTVKLEEVSVVVGSVDFSTNSGTRYQVSQIKLHDGYHYGNGWPNDIALLKLSQPIQFNGFVRPARLPRRNERFRDGQRAIVSGYGRLNPNGEQSSTLYKTQVFVVNNNQCQRSYSQDLIRPTHICTRNSQKTGWCKGDSGGPLTINGKVVGLVSFSLDNGCAWDSMAPQVYTRVSKYIDWIYQHM